MKIEHAFRGIRGKEKQSCSSYSTLDINILEMRKTSQLFTPPPFFTDTPPPTYQAITYNRSGIKGGGNNAFRTFLNLREELLVVIVQPTKTVPINYVIKYAKNIVQEPCFAKV